jgi:hypothetical protein
MAIQQIILLIINALGGIAVIGSYIWGFAAHPGSTNALWGGVSNSVRGIYFISMIISALGYFAFIYYILFPLNPGEVEIAGRFGFNLFYVIFLGMLIFSALWMPLTFSMINSPSTGTWIGLRTVLALVALFSIALVWALLTLNTRLPSVPYWLAVVGSAYFAFHTTVLDAIFWAYLFRQSTP